FPAARHCKLKADAPAIQLFDKRRNVQHSLVQLIQEPDKQDSERALPVARQTALRARKLDPIDDRTHTIRLKGLALEEECFLQRVNAHAKVDDWRRIQDIIQKFAVYRM